MKIQPTEISLTWEVRDRKLRASLFPKKYKAARLITELATAWKGYVFDNELAYRSSLATSSAIKNLGTFLNRKEDRNLSLHDDSQRLITRLFDWEKHLISTYSARSRSPIVIASMVSKLVAYYLASQNISNKRLEAWLESPTLTYYEDDKTIPLEEFSNAERIQIEQVCRQIVRSAEAFLKCGSKLRQAGRDPREFGWDSLENTVWGLSNLKADELPEDVPNFRYRQNQWKYVTKELPELEKHKDYLLGNPLFGLVAPSLVALTAYRVLIHLRSDISADETANLKRSNVQISDSGVTIRTSKPRADREFYHSFVLSNPDGEGWKPGDLFFRLKKALAIPHELVPETEVFWVGCIERYTSAKGLSRQGYPLWLAPSGFNVRYNLASIVRIFGLEISSPVDIRRCRKTVKSIKAVLLGTLNGTAGDDHTVEVFRDHYAQSSTVKVIAARTVKESQEFVMDRVGPLFVTGDFDGLNTEDQNEEIPRIVEEFKSETEIDKQLNVISCRDPRDRPGLEGELCMDAPFSCLSCKNGVIFDAHLSRLLSFRKYLRNQEKEMTPQQFGITFGQALRNLDEVVSHFSQKEIVEAEAENAEIRIELGKGIYNEF